VSTQSIQPTPIPSSQAMVRKFISMGAHVYVCDYGEKRCTEPAWEQKATNNLDEGLRIASGKPDGNVMLVGKQDGVWGLDDDAGLVREYEQQYGLLTTYGTKTVSGGRHFIFKQDAASWAMGNISVMDEGRRELLSARVNDRYVISAGSWAHPHNDKSQPLTQYQAINPAATFEVAPQSLLDFIKAKDAEWKAKRSQSTPTDQTARQVFEGGRNNYLTSRLGTLRTAGVSEETLSAEGHRLNKRDCVPPLPDSEVETIVKSVSKYPEGTPLSLILNQTPDAPAAKVETFDWLLTKEALGKKQDSWIFQNIPSVSQIPWEDERWVLHKFFLHHGLHEFTGPPGSWKSIMSVLLSHSLLQGEPFLGRANWGQPVKIIYIDKENPKATVLKRAKAIGLYESDNVRIWGLWDTENPPPDNLGDPRLLEAALRDDIVFVFDSLSGYLGNADENASKDMVPIMEQFLKLARSSVGVAILHHPPKNGEGSRGSGSIMAKTDMAFRIKKVGNRVTISPDRFRACEDYTITLEAEFGSDLHPKFGYKVVTDTLGVEQTSNEKEEKEREQVARWKQTQKDNELIQRAALEIQKAWKRGVEVNQSMLGTILGLPHGRERRRVLSGTERPWVCLPRAKKELFFYPKEAVQPDGTIKLFQEKPASVQPAGAEPVEEAF
jgi:hypothetical protein